MGQIGSFIRGLRAKMDDLLTEKISDATFHISGTSTMRLIVTLLLSDGMGCYDTIERVLVMTLNVIGLMYVLYYCE